MSATSNDVPHEELAKNNGKTTSALPLDGENGNATHTTETNDAPKHSTDVRSEDVPPVHAAQETVGLPIHAAATATVSEADETGEQDDTVYHEVAAEELLPPTEFRPFFTLIEDKDSGEHIHPAVHYIFSDDAPDHFTNAALAAIEQQTELTDVDERIAVIDIGSDGKTVVSASSLSPDWQNLKTSMAPAPSWGEPQGANGNFLLQISGGDESIKTLQVADAQSLDMEPLVKAFTERLALLDVVIGRLDEDERPA